MTLNDFKYNIVEVVKTSTFLKGKKMTSLFKKIIGGISVKANSAIDSIFGTETLEKASLKEIKEKIDNALNERNNLQASYNVAVGDNESMEKQIKDLEEIRDFNVNKFKETNEQTYKNNGMKAIDKIKEITSSYQEKSEELATQKSTIEQIDVVISHLRTIYNEKQKSHDSSITRSKIAESSNKAADLINDLSSSASSITGDSKLEEEAKHKEELSKIKVQDALKNSKNITDDFVSQSKKEMSQSSSEDEFNKLL